MADVVQLKDKTFKPYLSEEVIQKRIAEMAKAITANYRDSDVVFIAVLNGSFIFAADLFRCFSFAYSITFVKVGSYQGTESTGNVNQLIGLKEDLRGKHVVVLEDIIDTGLTISFLLSELKERQPASIKIATLLFKKAALRYPVEPDYIGFQVPEKFLVGYGLDYNGYGRHLRGLYEVE